MSISLHVFTSEDIKAATMNFTSKTYIGQGGSRLVHKSGIDELTLKPALPTKDTGMPVAMKKLKAENTSQGIERWQVKFLGRLHHPNLIKLIGYGSNKDIYS
ncbi:unnamed protein product [Urochloa humidicola]